MDVSVSPSHPVRALTCLVHLSLPPPPKGMAPSTRSAWSTPRRPSSKSHTAHDPLDRDEGRRRWFISPFLPRSCALSGSGSPPSRSPRSPSPLYSSKGTQGSYGFTIKKELDSSDQPNRGREPERPTDGDAARPPGAATEVHEWLGRAIPVDLCPVSHSFAQVNRSIRRCVCVWAVWRGTGARQL